MKYARWSLFCLALSTLMLCNSCSTTRKTTGLDFNKPHTQGTPNEGDDGGGGGSPPPAGVTLSLLPASQSVSAGSDFFVLLDVSASDVGGWNTVYDVFSYDSTKVSYVRQSMTPFLPSFCGNVSNYPQQNAGPQQVVILQGIACYQTFTSSAAVLDTVFFHAKSSTGTVSLTQSIARVNDGVVYLSPMTHTDASVTIN